MLLPHSYCDKLSAHLDVTLCTVFHWHLSLWNIDLRHGLCILHQDENTACPSNISTHSLDFLLSVPNNNTTNLYACDLEHWPDCLYGTLDNLNEKYLTYLLPFPTGQGEMWAIKVCYVWFNTLRLRQNGRRFADDIFKCIFLNENVWIPIKISLKFVPKGQINKIQVLVQIMAWRRPGDKPLSEQMMVSLPTHICVIRPQWVKYYARPSVEQTHIWITG